MGSQIKSLIIGVDVDDTVAELVAEWLHSYNQKYKDNIAKNEISSWNIFSFAHKATEEQFFELLTPKLYNTVNPINGALENINYLRSLNNRIVFITSSMNGYMGRKLQWLTDHGFLDKDTKFQTDYVEVTDKSLINYDIIVEDRADHINDAINNDKHAILFTQPWNIDYRNDSPFFHRADNWNQVTEWVMEIIDLYKMAQTQTDNMDITKGGVKYDNDKPAFDLIASYPLFELAKLYLFGAKKYAPNNHRAGMRWGRVFGAMMRHAWAFWGGEDIDSETGLSHLTSVAWCAFTLLEYTQSHPELDDRYKGN